MIRDLKLKIFNVFFKTKFNLLVKKCLRPFRRYQLQILHKYVFQGMGVGLTA